MDTVYLYMEYMKTFKLHQNYFKLGFLKHMITVTVPVSNVADGISFLPLFEALFL